MEQHQVKTTKMVKQLKEKCILMIAYTSMVVVLDYVIDHVKWCPSCSRVQFTSALCLPTAKESIPNNNTFFNPFHIFPSCSHGFHPKIWYK